MANRAPDLFAAAMALLFAGTEAGAASARRTPFGHLPDGTAIEAMTLTGANGVSARIMTLGATLQALNVADRQGRVEDVMPGYDDPASYVAKPDYRGQTIGRYANRIAGGRFSLDGRVFQLTRNDHVRSPHDGTSGFDKRIWRILSVDPGGAGKPAAVTPTPTPTPTSPAGDQGYPGKLDVTVTYSLDDTGSVRIDFDATTDATTIVNLTNHALFDLGGEGSATGALGARLTIPASRYTPVNAALIPTGEMGKVAGTVFDFTRGRIVAQIVAGRGYDHNSALDKGVTIQPQLAARLEDTVSGRVLEVLLTEPGVQSCSGNFLEGTSIGKRSHVYRMGDGIALKLQKLPDTPNQPAFGTARVEPGKPCHHRMIYRVSTTR